MEPPAEPARRRPWSGATRPPSLPVVSDRSLRGALAGSGIAACFVGLLGADGGLLWLILGLWAARTAWGRSPGIAWAVALGAAGLRWGTLGLLDVEVATRAVGAPAILVGPPLAAAGCILAIAGALLEEGARDDLRSEFLPRRIGAGIALIALVPAFLAPGSGAPGLAVSLAWWVGAAAGLVGIVSLVRHVADRLPRLVPVAASSVGLVFVGVASRGG